MPHLLPIGVDALLDGRVESARLEFKASWNAKTTGLQVLQTLCAFANDLQNLNGGYVVIGVAERDGVAVRPAAGLAPEQLDAAQKWIRGNCNRIEPPIAPLMAPETVDGQHVLVVHMPASDNRPHHAPDGEKGPKVAFVRVGSETVRANREPLRSQLYQQTARVPFDDRRAFDAEVTDLRESRVREFLRDVRSDLERERDPHALYRAMRLIVRVNGHHVPRNVGLMFFADDPRPWFPGAMIDVVRFQDGGGTTLEERRFTGPLHEQLRACLQWLENYTVRHVRKLPHDVEAGGFVSYPLLALREALVNAVYHRGYEETHREPTKVYLHPDRVEVISYPGPAPGLDAADFDGGRVKPLPARNRRIGELLKELRLAEERSTGVPKIYRSMEQNGSPPPRFDFDAERSYFRVTLPAHPEYVTVEALRDAAYLEATGDRAGALRRLRESLASRPDSAAVAVELVRMLGRDESLDEARAVLADFGGDEARRARVAIALAELLIDHCGAAGEAEAKAILETLAPDILAARDALDAAIVARRTGQHAEAHDLFRRAGALVDDDPKALHTFAQTKLALVDAMETPPELSHQREARAQLLREAERILERVVQLDAPRARHAWAWFDLSRVRRAQGAPASVQREALARAVALVDEPRFRQALARLEPSSDG